MLERKLDEFTQKLRKRGFYEASGTHRAVISEDKTSVNLMITVRSGPIVTVKYEGDPLPADRLKELVPVERDNSVAEDLLEDSVVAIRTYLRQQGYWKADVAVAARGIRATRWRSCSRSRRACATSSPTRWR